MECYFKSISEKRGYRQKIVMLWEEKGILKVTEQKLAGQARTLKVAGLQRLNWKRLRGTWMVMSKECPLPQFASAGTGDEAL